MKKGWIIFWCILAVVLFAGFSSCSYVVGVYNGLPTKEEKVFASFGNIESDLQRRNDLIPNYVETVKGYASHEKEALTAVIEARAKATQTKVDVNDAKAFAEFQKNQGALSSALSRLMVVVEKYPNLKANENFLKLQDELAGTENRINLARKRYNEAVRDFNTYIRTFPVNIINAATVGLKTKEPFKADDEAKKAPRVSFDKK